MASYLEWNAAIVDFFTAGLREGAPVYLTVDDEALDYIGNRYLQLPAGSARCDFISAIQLRCTSRVGVERHLALDGALARSNDKRPGCVAFLAAMVLAAHEMLTDEGQHIDGTNYFRRFGELLGLKQGSQSRPMGFETGTEESLWKGWNEWVASKGLKPTAHRGEGAWTYIEYPIEQALVRKDDRAHLEAKMRQQFRLPEDRMLDESQLASWLTRQKFTRRHLEAGFRSSDPDRASAFVDAGFRIYQSLNWTQSQDGVRNNRIKLSGGILRTVSIRGSTRYLLLARTPTRWKSAEIRVIHGGEDHDLARYRADVFAPLWPVSPFPDEAIEYPVEGDSYVESLFFPKRDFWILTTDPDDPRGQMGTWEKYPNLLGKKFWVILRKGSSLRQELEKYEVEGLLRWDEIVEGPDGVAEYRGCMILSRAWDCIVPTAKTEALYDALRPSAFASIAFSGGVKAPDGQGWLEGFPPSMAIYGFERAFAVAVSSAAGAAEFELQAQTPRILLECSSSGQYEIEATYYQRVVASRTIRIVSWTELQVATTPSTVDGRIGDLMLRGATISVARDDGSNV